MLGKNMHLGLQLRFLHQTSSQRNARTATSRKLFPLQLPMKTMQHSSMNDMKSLVIEPSVLQPSLPRGPTFPELRRFRKGFWELNPPGSENLPPGGYDPSLYTAVPPFARASFQTAVRKHPATTCLAKSAGKRNFSLDVLNDLSALSDDEFIIACFIVCWQFTKLLGVMAA